MNSLKFFSLTLVIGVALAGGPPRHHHHHGHRGYGRLFSSPVITKSSPIYQSKSVGPLISYDAPAKYISSAPAYVSNGPAYISSGPSYVSSDPIEYVSTVSSSPTIVSRAPATLVSTAPAAAVSYGLPATAAVSYGAPATAAVSYGAPATAAVSYGAPVASAVSYGTPSAVSYGAPVSSAVSYGAPAATAEVTPVAVLTTTSGKPKVYSSSIPAAAIRNIEVFMVTKTITPVITRTTTHHTSAEPAVSVGHVQGYSQGVVGLAKLAPVQFNTQYTTYANPTVGVNGPVVYSGVAPAQTVAVAAQPVVKSAAIASVPTGTAVVSEPGTVYKTAAVVSQQAPVYKTVVSEPATVYKTAAVVSQPAPVYKTIEPAQIYKTASLVSEPAPAIYKTLNGGVSYENYGVDAYSVPSTSFLEVKSGSPVFTSGGYADKKKK